ncbi:DUF4153 domain-containing protein [Paenibacillus validus]|uniref:DUF4153 domain-containing protein n=1 Tax=Paenibacillus validus TaxID=44253 RepID=UPI003D284872
MKLHSNERFNEKKLLLASLGCGVVHHYLFYDRSWGVSVPVFVLGFYLLFYTMAQGHIGRKKDPSLLLLLPVGLLALTYALYTNMLFAVLNALAIPFLVVLHTTWLTSRGGKAPIWVRMLEQVFVQTLLYAPRPFAVLFGWMSVRMKAGRSRTLMKVLLGLLLSVPLLAAVVGLLASADTMFDRSLARLPNLFEDVELGRTLFRALWIGAITVGVFAYVAGLLQPKLWSSARPASPYMPKTASVPSANVEWGVLASDGAVSQATAPSAAPSDLRLDPTVASTVLIALNAVYLLFAFVQFSYFFGGGGGAGAAALPEGVTYAFYARQGFAELVVVTLINLTVLITFLYGVRRPGPLAWTLLRTLLALLVGCTGIMLSSAYLRLSMYEEAYGYTVTRLLVHAFMIFLLVLFVLALVKLWREKLPLLRYYGITALAAYVLINYMGIDAMIAQNNIKRYENSGVIDVGYLGGLSFEAVPHLVDLRKNHPELDAVEGVLHNFTYRLERQEGSASWTEFNVSKRRASQMLQPVKPAR